MRKITFGLAAGLLAVLALVSAVSAHAVQSVSGTVDCSTNYTITVHADVWGGTHLIVTLGTTTVVDEAESGNDQSVRTFTFNGTGGIAGEVITAKTGDQSKPLTATLVANPEVCPTPTPSPTPTPTPTGSAVSTPTPPLTATTETTSNGDGSGWLLVALLLASASVMFTVQQLDRRGNL
jgi:hypothetical protein